MRIDSQIPLPMVCRDWSVEICRICQRGLKDHWIPCLSKIRVSRTSDSADMFETETEMTLRVVSLWRHLDPFDFGNTRLLVYVFAARQPSRPI